MRVFRVVIVLSFMCLSLSTMYGQQDGRPTRQIDTQRNTGFNNQNNSGFPIDTTNQDSLFKKSGFEGPDTTIYDYYKLTDLYDLRPFSDTLNDDLHRYNPAQRINNDHLFLGNLGSSAIPVRYRPLKNIGLDLGYHQYDLYNLNPDSLKFYRVNRPLNDLYYSPVAGQGNFLVKGKFYRSFSDNTHLHIDYTRYLQEGFYSEQNTKTTNLGLSLDYKSPGNTYRAFISLINNFNNESQNGGVSDTTLYNTDFYEIRFRIPVYLTDAARRNQQSIIAFNQFVNMDSLIPGFKVQLRNELSIDRGFVKYADLEVDSSFYGRYWIENRGLRQYLSYSTSTVGFHLNLRNQDRFVMSHGLSYKRYSVDDELLESSQNSLQYQASLKMDLWDRFVLNATSQLGLWDFAGDFKIQGKLTGKLNKDYLQIHGIADFYNYTPTYEQNRLVVNQTVIWNNDFSKTFGTRLGGEISIPKLNLSASLIQTVENNSIYRNIDGSPGQLGDILSVTELHVKHLFSLWKLRLKNDFLVQQISDDRIIRPKYLSKHAFYFESLLFDDNLDLQLGLDYTHWDDYSGLAFNPVNGQFVPSNNPIKNYPLLDAFANAKIDGFQVFFKAENLGFFFLDENIGYLIEDYPLFDFKFRMGIRWLLKD